MEISVVVPVYGCPEALEPLHRRLADSLCRITKDYEIILVNDGCPKNSWGKITRICQEDKRVVGINLSRNFGQINATNAGLEYSTGDYVVLLDCDLQDPPEAIGKLYDTISEGYDVVYVCRENRKDKGLVKFCSKAFYKLYNYFVEGYYNPDVCNYCIVKRVLVDQYCALPEHNKNFTTILSWMGYRAAEIGIESEERFEGKSSYNLRKRVNLAIDMITFQSNKPLYFFVKIGCIIGALSILYIIYQLAVYFIVGNAPLGWMSLIAVVCLLGGIQLTSIGVIGIYIGNIFNESKARNSYFIQEILNGRGQEQ